MPSLEGAQAWLVRAEEHLTDLKNLCSPFTEAEVDAMIASIRLEFADEGGGWAYTRPAAPVPVSATVLTGEVIQALRRSLDYLIYELAWLDSGSEQADTQFPIDEWESTFERRRQRKASKRGGVDHACFLVGISDQHAAAIKLLQPFRETDWTKTLGSISNLDKHRHLTVAKSQSSVSVSGWTVAANATDREIIRAAPNAFTFSMNLGSSVPTRMHMKFHVTAYMSLEDGRDLIETLENLVAEVGSVLADFSPCFEGKCHHKSP